MAVSPRENSSAIRVPAELVQPRERWHLLPLTEHSIQLLTLGVVLCDALLACVLFVVAYWLRHPGKTLFIEAKSPLLPWLPYQFHYEFWPYLSVLYFVPLIQVACCWYRGLYRVRGEFSFSEDFINIFAIN